MRACYEELLREVLAIHRAVRRGEDRPLYGNDPERRNVTGAARIQAVTANGQDVELSASRLRSTWLVAAMSVPVPLGALLGAAGLRSARTLVDLVPYCPAPTPSDVARLLRMVEDQGPSVWTKRAKAAP